MPLLAQHSSVTRWNSTCLGLAALPSSVFPRIFNREVGSMTGYSFSGLCLSLCLSPLGWDHHSVATSASFNCHSSVMFLFPPLFIFLTHNRRTVSRGRKACSSLQSMRFSRLWYLSPFHFLSSCFLHFLLSNLLWSMFVICINIDCTNDKNVDRWIELWIVQCNSVMSIPFYLCIFSFSSL